MLTSRASSAGSRRVRAAARSSTPTTPAGSCPSRSSCSPVSSVVAGLINLPFSPLGPPRPLAHPGRRRRTCSTRTSPPRSSGTSLLPTCCSLHWAWPWRSSLWRGTAERRRPSRPSCAGRGTVDWAYDRLLARGSTELAEVTALDVETRTIDGAVNGVGALFRSSARVLRKVQNGIRAQLRPRAHWAGPCARARLRRVEDGVMGPGLPLPHRSQSSSPPGRPSWPSSYRRAQTRLVRLSRRRRTARRPRVAAGGTVQFRTGDGSLPDGERAQVDLLARHRLVASGSTGSPSSSSC